MNGDHVHCLLLLLHQLLVVPRRESLSFVRLSLLWHRLGIESSLNGTVTQMPQRPSVFFGPTKNLILGFFLLSCAVRQTFRLSASSGSTTAWKSRRQPIPAARPHPAAAAVCERKDGGMQTKRRPLSDCNAFQLFSPLPTCCLLRESLANDLCLTFT